MARVTPEALIGTVLGGRYRLVAVLGRGGMGTVYDAVQEDLGRRVAVKVLNLDLAHDPSFVQRMQREARAVSSIDHPAIVQVTDFQVTSGGLPFLVMERLQGRSLHDAIAREAPMPPSRVVHIFSQVLAALAAAHDKGLVHRDVKPDNIFLVATPATPDYVKLLDFGVAKPAATGHDAPLSRQGAVIGTTDYMAPEQARGEEVDGRADLYAVGACLYEALLGPAAISTAATAGRSALDRRVPSEVIRGSIRGLAPTIDPALASVVETALERDKERRFQSAQLMLGALRASTTPTGSVTPHNAPTPEGHSGSSAAVPSPRVVIASPAHSPSFAHAPTASHPPFEAHSPLPSHLPPPRRESPALGHAPAAARRRSVLAPILVGFGLVLLGGFSACGFGVLYIITGSDPAAEERDPSAPAAAGPAASAATTATGAAAGPSTGPAAAASQGEQPKPNRTPRRRPAPSPVPSPVPPPAPPRPETPPLQPKADAGAPSTFRRLSLVAGLSSEVIPIPKFDGDHRLRQFGRELTLGPYTRCYHAYHPLPKDQATLETERHDELIQLTVFADGHVGDVSSPLPTGTPRIKCMEDATRAAHTRPGVCPKARCGLQINTHGLYR